MTKLSKLSEYGIEKEARDMKDSGMGLYEIARVLTETHPEVKGGFSHMSIKRGLEGIEKRNLQVSLQEGQNIEEIISQRFINAIDKNNKKLNKLMKIANQILENALVDGSITEKTKALKEAREGLSQERSNWIALKQWGTQEVGHVSNVHLQKIEEMRNEINIWTDDLSSFSEDLCPECKKKFKEKLKKKLEKL